MKNNESQMNKKLKKAGDESAKMIRHLHDKQESNRTYKYYTRGKYLNVSERRDCAPVSRMVRHSPDERGSTEHPGSIPGWSASIPLLMRSLK